MDDVMLQLNHLLFSGDFGARENETTYIETLAPILTAAMASARTDDIVDVLSDLEAQKEAELKAHCDACAEPFFETAEYLEQIRSGAVEIGDTAVVVHSQITRSGAELVDAKNRHAQLSQTTHNIEMTLDTLRLCLKALEYTNQVHTLLKQNHRIAAVQALSELKNLGLHNMRHLGLAKMLSKSVPGLTDLIFSSTKATLDTFVQGLSGGLQIQVGETSYNCLAKQRQVWRKLQQKRPHLEAFRFNSHAERAYRESTTNYFDYSQIGLDLGPLHEAHLVFNKLGKLDDFVNHLHSLRVAQAKQLDGGSWDQLQSVAGFCVIERVISLQLSDLRPAHLVDDMCDQLCQRFTQNLTKRIKQIEDLKELNPIRKSLTQFMETLENFGFNVNSTSALLVELLRHLSTRLVEANRRSFLDTWNQADHMPMVVNKPELYDTIRGVVFDQIDERPTSFPKVLPFSEIYPLMCADLRSLISHHTSFFDQFQRDPVVVEETLVQAVDSYLTDTVCKTMTESLSIDNREKLVQTVVDLKYLIDAAVSVRSLLQQNRLSGRRGKLVLRAVPEFENAYRLVESKVFELVNTSIDHFVSMADYDWQQTASSQGAQSPYALDMAAYLLTLANSVLARLPTDLKAFVYLSTIDHLNMKLMNLLLSADESVTPQVLEDFDVDLKFLESTVSQLSPNEDTNLSMVSTLAEVRQGIDLMRSEDPAAEYNNPQIRMRKYDRLRPDTVTKLVHKLTTPVSTPKLQQTKNFMRYLSGDKT